MTAQPSPTGPARTLRVVALAVALAAGLGLVSSVAWAVPAGAHDDDAIAEVVSVEPGDSRDALVVTARLTYSGDGDPVTDATVTVAGDDGAGTQLTPVPMTAGPEPGLWVATVTLPGPGTWNLRVTSVNPTAQVGFTQSMATALPDEGASATTAPTTAPTTASTTTTTEATAGGVPDLDETEQGQDDDGSPWAWILGGAAAAVAVLVGLVFVARGRRPGRID